MYVQKNEWTKKKPLGQPLLGPEEIKKSKFKPVIHHVPEKVKYSYFCHQIFFDCW